jgi:hypothetical protein
MDGDGFERKLSDLESRERELERREEAARARGLRRNLYEYVNISVGKLDMIIAILSLSIAALIIIGALKRS